jgi:hypothetical protein
MNPTFFHLLFLFIAPLIWFSGNKSARLLVLSAIPLIALISTDLAPFSIAGFIAAISLDHRKSFALSSSSSSRAIVCYTALCTLPLWLPSAWVYWPGQLLSNAHWDPARKGELYAKFGSQQALRDSAFWQPLAACIVASILLFAYDRLVAIIKATSHIEETK